MISPSPSPKSAAPPAPEPTIRKPEQQRAGGDGPRARRAEQPAAPRVQRDRDDRRRRDRTAEEHRQHEPRRIERDAEAGGDERDRGPERRCVEPDAEQRQERRRVKQPIRDVALFAGGRDVDALHGSQ